MTEKELGEAQSRFADLIWDRAPISSGELVRLCLTEFSWKKPTTYTVLRKLCEKGLFKNENGTVTPLLSRDEYYSGRSRKFVDDAFDGSLPAFLAAFISGRRLSAGEAEEIQRMIDRYREVEK